MNPTILRLLREAATLLAPVLVDKAVDSLRSGNGSMRTPKPRKIYRSKSRKYRPPTRSGWRRRY